jgi:hypothetical protein
MRSLDWLTPARLCIGATAIGTCAALITGHWLTFWVLAWLEMGLVVTAALTRHDERQPCPKCRRRGEVEYGIRGTTPPVEDRMCGKCWAARGRLGRRASIRACKSAPTMRDLCTLTAQWLTGRLAVCVTYDGPPDPETVDLVAPLVLLNQAGILTGNSQPGCDGPAYNGLHVEQRAFVDVFCPPALAPSFRRAMTAAGMIVAGEGEDDPQLMRGEFVFRGNRPWKRRPVKRIGIWYTSRPAFRELAAAEYFTVVDPVWGRADSPLWDAITEYTAGVGKA